MKYLTLVVTDEAPNIPDEAVVAHAVCCDYIIENPTILELFLDEIKRATLRYYERCDTSSVK